jgi:rubrerythrin
LALDENFNIDRIVFTKSDFMELIRAGLPPGSFIVAEEIGTWFSNREFLSQGNIGLSKIIQTFRHQRLGVIFNLPHLRMVDKNLRTMGDASLEMTEIDRKNEVGIGKYKLVTTNPNTGEAYSKFPRVMDGKETRTITIVKIHRPPKELEELYLQKKEEHMEKFNAMIHHGFKDDDDDKPKTEKKYEYKCLSCGTIGTTNQRKPRCSSCKSQRTKVYKNAL